MTTTDGASPTDTPADTPTDEPAPGSPAAEGPPPTAVAKAPAEPAPPAWTPRTGDDVTPHYAIEFPERLAPFLEQLARVDDGEQQIARVLHFGASMIGMDDLTGVLRDRFQTRFGDGGAGLVLLQRYMTNYMHRSVLLDGRGWQYCYIAYLCRKDGHYGLGGVTFTSTSQARTKVATRREGFGSSASRMEVWYAATPQGGKLSVRVDGKEPEILDTRADALEDRWHAIDVEPGPHEIEVRPYGAPVRAYGVVLETDGPGVVWDQFSMLGAFTKRMLAWGEDHIKGQIARRDPHLVVFTYGGNDLRRFATNTLDVAQFTDEFAESIERVRAGKPSAACLVVGISDRGRTLTYEVEAQHMAAVTESSRKAAERAGCAFFDTYAAMGGVGSAKRWRAKDPPLSAGDLKHLTHAGNVVLGGWIYDAIVHEYVRHRLAAPGSVPEG